MANFWDLPKPVREQIYRSHLVQEDPVDLHDFEVLCGGLAPLWHNSKSRRGKPQLLEVCKRTEREAASIYFGENTFACEFPHETRIWKLRLWPRHLGLVRRIIVNGWTKPENYGGGYNEEFRLLASFKSLKVLTLKVDEQMSLEKKLQHHQTIKWHSSLGCGVQLSLQALHFCGIHGLNHLTSIPLVEFPPFSTVSACIILSVINPPDIIVSRYKRIGHFRFLELPPEIRNDVYALLLVFSGVTYPKVDTPTSVACQFPYLRDVDKDDLPVPHSALSILQTNRQIHNEAVGMFYRQNDFVFSYPSHLQDLIQSLERDRLESVSSLTLFHKNHSEGGMSTMATTLKLLRRLRGLKKLHLLIEQHMVAKLSWSSTQIVKRCVTRIQGVAVLFTLRGIADIKLRDLDLEDRTNQVGKYAASSHVDNVTVKEAAQILEHFNHGLTLAQGGIVVEELCDDRWWCEDKWPVLGDSACGRSVGCMCGKPEGEDTPKTESD
jgi:hypothetical protein